MRRLRVMMIWVLLGATVSGAVAGAGAVWLPIARRQVGFPPGVVDAQRAIERMGAGAPGWGPAQRAVRTQSAALTRWSVSGSLRGEASGEYLATLLLAGWPARCQQATALWDSDSGTIDSSVWRSGVRVPAALRPWKHDPRRYNSTLPLRPIAAGWAINTVFFAALLWAGVSGWRLVRVAWRTCRGRCPACGYPAAGDSRCPECGAATKSPARGGAQLRAQMNVRATSCPS